LNLYKLHSKPETLDLHDLAFEAVPELVWWKYKYIPTELKKREKILARDPWVAYEYALFLDKPFPAGEAAIAKDAVRAYQYARDVLHGPFPAGEAAIAEACQRGTFFPGWALWYARSVLQGPFPAGEAAIAENPYWAYHYACYVLKGPFPAGEAAIALVPDYERQYARLLHETRR
jgi:hypothetical protein